MVLSAAISTLMVLFCGLGIDIQDFWDIPGSLNDPSGNKHKWELTSLVTAGENFKSVQVDSWDSLGFDFVRLSACSRYGDIWWTTEFNATTVGSALKSWAAGPNITNTTATGAALPQDVDFNTTNYRLLIRPASTTSYAWFSISLGSMSYAGFPIAFIAKVPSTPFMLPAIREGYLGCWPDTQMANLTQKIALGNASYENCRIHCEINKHNAVVIKLSTECYCGNLVNNPIGQDSTYCFLNCPGNNAQKCGGFDSSWSSVYHLPGSELPGSTTTDTIFSSNFVSVTTIEIDIAQLEPTTGNPAFISDIMLVSTPSTNTYELFYSPDPCLDYNLRQFTINTNQTNFQAAGNNLAIGLIMVRCIQIQMSAFSDSVYVTMNGPANTDHIEVPVVVIQGVKMIEVTTTTSTPVPTTSTTTTPTTTTSTTTTTTSTLTSTTSSTSTTTPTILTTTTEAPSTSPDTTSAPTSSSITKASTEPTTSASMTLTRSTTTATSKTKTSTSPQGITTTPNPTTRCICNCNDVIPQTNMTAAELQEKIEALKRQLAVNTTNLSSYIRAKTSARDDRPSAVSIGALGVALLIIVFGSVLLIDSTVLYRDLKLLWRNIRGFFTE